jgi:hypothetical protein
MIMKKILSIIIAGIWITVFEFVRNEFLLKSYWINHFDSLGLMFETLTINGILWMLWSFIFAYVLFRLAMKFSFWETIILGWLVGFVMMWIVIYNLQVLALELLIFAIPLSLIEVIIAVLIILRICNKT